MPEIELPAYRTIVSNEIFGKKAGFFEYPLIGKVLATQITRLSRFKIPTQEEVIDFIRMNAKSIDPLSLGKDNQSQPGDSSPNNLFLKSLPSSEIKDIARGDKNSLKHLVDHYPADDLQEGRTYLRAYSGIVPNQVLDLAKESIAKEGTEAYDKAIERIGAKEWNLKIRLLEDGKFPDTLELEYLIDRGVKDSYVFSAEGDFGDYSAIANQIRLLCNALGSTGLVSLVGDTSYKFLEQKATLTIKETAQCIAKRKAIGGLVGIIAQTMGSLSRQGEQKKSENPFWPFNNCESIH